MRTLCVVEQGTSMACEVAGGIKCDADTSNDKAGEKAFSPEDGVPVQQSEAESEQVNIHVLGVTAKGREKI